MQQYIAVVNGRAIEVNGGRYNGRKIRQMASIPDDHDLWLKAPGSGDDRRLGDDDAIPTHPQVVLYSAPREINGA